MKPRPAPQAVLHSIPLRARKAAQTRLAFLDRLTERLRESPLDEIPVKALCADVGVSEPTFFNYFGSKHDVLVFFVQLWSVDVQIRMGKDEPSPFVAIQRLFAHTGAAVARNPRLMYEIIAHQTRGIPTTLAPPTASELTIRFAGFENASRLSPKPLEALLEPALTRAVREGSLPRRTDVARATLVLASLFFGAPAAHRDPGAVKKTYAAGLRTIWRGLGGSPEEE